jgi:hypothetical protein
VRVILEAVELPEGDGFPGGSRWPVHSRSPAAPSPMAAPSAPSQLRRRRSLATAVVVDATRGDPVARPDPGRSGRAKRALHPLAGLGNHPGRRWACRGGAAAAGGAQRLRHGRLSGPMPAARAWSAPLPLQAPRGRPGRAACARRPRAGAGAGPHLQGPCGRGAGRHLRTLTRPTLGSSGWQPSHRAFGPGRSRLSLHVPSVEHPWTRLGRGPSLTAASRLGALPSPRERPAPSPNRTCGDGRPRRGRRDAA